MLNVRKQKKKLEMSCRRKLVEKEKSKLRQLWIQAFKIGKEDKIENKRLDKIRKNEEILKCINSNF